MDANIFLLLVRQLEENMMLVYVVAKFCRAESMFGKKFVSR